MIEDVINRGIPSEATCTISYSDLVFLSDDSKKTDEKLIEWFNKYKKIAEKTIEDEIGLFHGRGMLVATDPKTLKRQISFNPTYIFNPILTYLGFYDKYMKKFSSNNITRVEKDESVMFREIEKLKKINGERQLRRKYPYLHELYATYVESYRKLKSVAKNGLISEAEREKLYKDFQYDTFKKYSDIDYFIDRVSNSFELIMKKEKLLKEIASNFTIPLEAFEDIPDDKLSLYLASQFLAQSDFSASKQKCLYYVANYFNANPELKNSTEPLIGYGIDHEGKPNFHMTPKKLYEEFKEVLAFYPELNFVDVDNSVFENMDLFEVDEYMNKYFEELSLNWDFLSPDDNTITKEYVAAVDRAKREEREIDTEKLLDLYIEKKQLFDSSSPYLILKGKNTFNGYAGYLYENGKVVLEKFFADSHNKRIATGEAIYVMGIDQFHELSKKSKTDLMRSDLCERITHRGNWQERVINAIKSGEKKDIDKEINKLKKVNINL